MEGKNINVGLVYPLATTSSIAGVNGSGGCQTATGGRHRRGVFHQNQKI